MKIKTKNKRGSILAYALVILTAMLAIASSLSVVAVIEKKGASSTEFSMQSLQTADSGVQMSLKIINTELLKSNPGTIATVLPSCVNGKVVSSNAGPTGSSYELTFLDKNSAALPCTAEVSTIANIKSVGVYKNTVRAVQVSVSSCIGEIISNGITYKKILSVDGNCWLDRNLGATQVATSVSDSAAYGWYFQWGRSVDGHQVDGSTAVVAVSATDAVAAPNTGNFLRSSAANNYDWHFPQKETLWQGLSGINNPCPTGFRIPTVAEWNSLKNAENIVGRDSAWASSLKLPSGGERAWDTAVKTGVGTSGLYWLSDTLLSGGKNYSQRFIFDAATASTASSYRASGSLVRCIRN